MDRISLNHVLTDFLGQSSAGLSPRVWSRIRHLGTGPAGSSGFFIGDDFLKFQGLTNAISGTTALPSVTVPSPEGYSIYIDSGTTASGIARLNTAAGGVARFAPGGTNDHLAMMTPGTLGAVSLTAGSDKLTVFEARVRLPTQVSSGSTFVGLATVSCVANDGIDPTVGGGLLVAGAGIGFRTVDADPDGIDAVYQAASQTEQVVYNEAKVAAADTWYKLGVVYDPAAPASQKIKYYVDNVELSTYVTATQMGAATFPNGTMLAPVIGCKGDSTTVRLLDVDWWAAYQQA